MSDEPQVNFGPWTIEEAREACRKATKGQQGAEDRLKQAYKEFAEAEEDYRKTLALEIVQQHDNGVAWTVAPDLARGNIHVAEKRRVRDIKEGLVEAAKQASWRHTANRKDTQRFADWSQRREFADGYRSEDPALDWSTQPVMGSGVRA
jgi:hypothetical protein